VIATGYGEDALRKRFKDDDRVTFLGKPYFAEDLRTALASLNVAGEQAPPNAPGADTPRA